MRKINFDSVKFWRILFILNVAAVVFCSTVGTISYFLFPKIPIAVTLGANVWAAFMCGGLTKDLLWGGIIVYSWFKGYGNVKINLGVVIKKWKFWD